MDRLPGQGPRLLENTTQLETAMGLPLPAVMCTAAHLGGLEHDLRGVVEVGQRAFGEPRGEHEHGGDLDVQAPRVHAVLGAEALGQDEANVHKALDKGEVPAIAAQAERPVRRTSAEGLQWAASS
jgi:hypothetical protein